MKSVITGIFFPSWRFPEYTISEKLNLWRGRAYSRSFGLWEQIIRVDLRKTLPKLSLPVYFFNGVYDFTCSSALAEDYFRDLRAPVKGFYRFGESVTARFSKSRNGPGTSCGPTCSRGSIAWRTSSERGRQARGTGAARGCSPRAIHRRHGVPEEETNGTSGRGSSARWSGTYLLPPRS